MKLAAVFLHDGICMVTSSDRLYRDSTCQEMGRECFGVEALNLVGRDLMRLQHVPTMTRNGQKD